MAVYVKSAKELLAKHNSNEKQKKKKNLSISVDVEMFDKLNYLSTQTNTSKNEIINNALINFGLNEIVVPNKKVSEN